MSPWWRSREEVTATLRLLLALGDLDWEQDEVLYFLSKPWKWTEERTRALALKEKEEKR